MRTASVQVSWQIHDSWTELLLGVHFLANLLSTKPSKRIAEVNLLRLVIVTSHQMSEVMFFHQLLASKEVLCPALQKELRDDIEHGASFSQARKKWPQRLKGKPLPVGSEPLQSMIRLEKLRNEAIHHRAKTPRNDVAESVFFTAIQSSKTIYEFFTDLSWQDSSYYDFVEKYPPKSKTLIQNMLRNDG